MHKMLFAAALAGALPMLAAPGLAQSTTPTPAPTGYSVDTTLIGVLLDDPAAKAVLEKHVPQVIADPRLEQARPMTFKQVQQYAPDQLTDEVLARIQADLSKLPTKG